MHPTWTEQGPGGCHPRWRGHPRSCRGQGWHSWVEVGRSGHEWLIDEEERTFFSPCVQYALSEPSDRPKGVLGCGFSDAQTYTSPRGGGPLTHARTPAQRLCLGDHRGMRSWQTELPLIVCCQGCQPGNISLPPHHCSNAHREWTHNGFISPLPCHTGTAGWQDHDLESVFWGMGGSTLHAC